MVLLFQMILSNRRDWALRGNSLCRRAAHTRDRRPPGAGRSEAQHSADGSGTRAEVDARWNGARNGGIARHDQIHGVASIWGRRHRCADFYSGLLNAGGSGATGLLAAGAAGDESGSDDRTAKRLIGYRLNTVATEFNSFSLWFDSSCYGLSSDLLCSSWWRQPN